MTDWQPIETAPQDKSHFLVYCEQTKRVVEVVPYVKRGRHGRVESVEWIDWHSNSLNNVKYWIPLPEPPNGKA